MLSKIQFVTGIHGNEPLPVLALDSLGVSHIVANPDALSLGVRFIEKDMNLSFGINGNTLEEKRAKVVLEQVDKQKIVVDLHTYSAISEPFVIIVDKKMKNFAASLGFKQVVFMKHNIKKGRSLINHSDGVSVELGNHKDRKSFFRVVDLVNQIQKVKKKQNKVNFYEVYDIINQPGEYKNFRLYKGEFVPVLAGEKAYDFYGLKARKVKEKSL